jgi:hypothetical protein
MFRQDGALDPWLQGVWHTLLQAYPLPEGQTILPDNVLYPFVVIRISLQYHEMTLTHLLFYITS